MDTVLTQIPCTLLIHINSYSSKDAFSEILFGSLLGPLLFNIYNCDFFLKKVTLLLIMMMIIHLMPVHQTFILLSLKFRKKHRKNFLTLRTVIY